MTAFLPFVWRHSGWILLLPSWDEVEFAVRPSIGAFEKKFMKRKIGATIGFAFLSLHLFSAKEGPDYRNHRIEFTASIDYVKPGFQHTPPKSPNAPAERELGISLKFKNISTQAVRIGVGVSPNRSDTDKRIGFSYYLVKLESEKGEPIARSIVDLKPVDLLPGEVTYVFSRVYVSSSEDVNNIFVSYIVDKETAVRYGIWEGRLTARAVVSP